MEALCKPRRTRDEPTAALSPPAPAEKIRILLSQKVTMSSSSSSSSPLFPPSSSSSNATSNAIDEDDGDDLASDLMRATAERMHPLVLEPGVSVYRRGDFVTETSGAFFILSGSVTVMEGTGPLRSQGDGGGGGVEVESSSSTSSWTLNAGDVFGSDALTAKGAMELGQRAETVTVTVPGAGRGRRRRRGSRGIGRLSWRDISERPKWRRDVF